MKLSYFKTYYGSGGSGNFIPDELLKSQFEDQKSNEGTNFTYKSLFIETDQIKCFIILNN